MGLDDRDYMKDDSDDVVNLNEILVAGFKLIAILALLLILLRIPPIWIKLPLMIAVLFVGWRWIARPSRKKPVARKRKAPAREKPVPTRSSAANRPQEELSPVKKLIALDAAGEFGKAKTFIQQLDGQEFPTEIGEELAVLAKNYFPVRLDETEEGVKFCLD